MRRLRSDLIEVYNIMHNLEGLKREDFFPLRSAGRRGYQYTITKQYIFIIVTSTAENTSSHKGWSTSGTGYQLQTFVQRQLINRLKNQIDTMLWQHGGLFKSQRRLSAPVIQTRRSPPV